MRLRHFGGRTLSTMADYAAPVFDVVGYLGMGAKRFGARGCTLEALLGHSYMAGRASIHHREFRQPDLLNSPREMMLQGRAIRTRGDKFAVLPLIMPPLIEEVFGRRHRKRD